MPTRAATGRHGCASRRTSTPCCQRCGRRSRTRRRRRADGRLVSTSATSPPSTGRPPTSSTRTTSAPGAAHFAMHSPRCGPTSTTPARPSCAPRWPAGRRGGARPRRRAPVASSPSRCAPGFPPERDRVARQQQVVSRAGAAPSQPGSGRIVVDSFDEIDRLAGWPPQRRRTRRRCSSASPSASRRTPTSSSPPRTRTRSSASPSPTGTPPRRCGESWLLPALELVGLHSHIGSQIFDTAGFEVAARRVVGLHAEVRDEHGVELPRARPRRRPRHRLHRPTTTRAARATSPPSMRDDRRRRSAALRASPVPRLSVEPGARSPGPRRSRCTRSAPSRRSLDGGAARTYVAVDGGMSDNIRPALYDADYSCTLASRTSRRARRCCARSSASTARAATSSSRTRSCPADIAPGDLLAVPAPARTAARWPATTTTCRGRPSSPSGRRGPVVVRRETTTTCSPRRRCRR